MGLAALLKCHVRFLLLSVAAAPPCPMSRRAIVQQQHGSCQRERVRRSKRLQTVAIIAVDESRA